jgi:hypothetical protein
LIITSVESITEGQPPEATVLYLTVYVPGVLDDGYISPVNAFKNNPAGEDVY